MDKIAAFAAVFSGIFIAVFVITFLWGVGKRILRWTVIIAVAYVGIIISLRVVHLSDDGVPLTMENLLSMTLGSDCSLGASNASRSHSCTGPAK
jgi:cytochrome c biogenesis protein CcdA